MDCGDGGRGAGGRSDGLAGSVVRVLGPDRRAAGTGFLLGDQLVVTCAHVVADPANAAAPDTVVVEFSGSVARAAAVDAALWRPPGQGDIAFVRLAEPAPPAARPLPLGLAGGARGRPVKAFGFPANAPASGHYGYAIAGDLIGSGASRLLQLTECSEVTIGFSGGPVVDEGTGLVIGMVSSVAMPDRLGRGGQTAYATPAEVIRAGCPELAVSVSCPYVGLRPFTSADAPLFYGRERAVRAVLASLRAEPGFLALLGPSGSGKSSLIQAGVLPALARGELAGSDRWDVVTVMPGTDPFAQLAEAGLSGAEAGLDAAVRSCLDSRPGRDRLVLVFDQFEELLVQTQPAPRVAVLGQLADLAEGTAPVTVMIAMRDDFYSTLAAAAPALMPAVGRGLVNVPATLDLEELTSIIARPAASAGIAVEPNLAERIASDAALVTPSPGAARSGAPVTVLPLLSSALAELWERQQDGLLTHHMYERMGGIIGWLDRWCDRSHEAARKRLPAAQRHLTRQVLTSLIRPGEPADGIPPTRQRRTLEQIRSADEDAETETRDRRDAERQDTARTGVADAIRVLADERLVTTARDPASGTGVVELAHESLIHEWRLLGRWLTEDQEFLSWRRDLEAGYAQWEKSKAGTAPDPELLLHGTALEQARRWLASRAAELSAPLVRFITDSDRAERDRLTLDHRRATRFRLLAIAAAVAAVAAFAFAGAASYQGIRANDQAAIARQQALVAEANKLSAEATGLVSTQPDLAALLAMQSIATTPDQAGWGSLETVLSHPTEVSRVLYGGGSQFNAVAYSPDGSLVGGGGENGQVWIWNAATGRPVGSAFPPVDRFSGDTVQGLAFSRDGKDLVTIGSSLQVWSVATHSMLRQLVAQTHSFLGSVAFSPDGTLLAAAYGGQVSLWNTVTWQPVGHVMREPQGEGDVQGLAFSRDGTSIAFCTDVGYVGIWNTATQVPLVTASVPKQADRVAFSPDGSQLAVASWGGSVYLFSAATGRLVRQLPGTTAPANALAYSPDGSLLAVGDEQGGIRLWAPATGQQLSVPLAGHAGSVQDLAYSPDGKQLASASTDGTIRLWNLTVSQPLGTALTGHVGSVNGVAFSPGGHQVATVGDDQTARVWNVASATQERVISPFGALAGIPPLTSAVAIRAVAWSPDGSLLATAGGQVSLWQASTGQAIATLLDATDVGWQDSVAFSPDGRLLATGGDDGVRLFTVATRKPYGPALPGTLNTGGAIAFSPDGKLLAVADNGISLWDVATRKRLTVLPEPANRSGDLYSTLAFSPDGTVLAAAEGGFGNPGVQLWNVADRKPLGALAPQTLVDALAFSPDARLLATGGDDGSIGFWQVATGQQFGTLVHLHTAAVEALAFNPAGTMLASASADSTARLWAVPRSWLEQACHIAGRNLTAAEWKQYVGTGLYVRDCPQYPSGVGAPASAPAAGYPATP